MRVLYFDMDGANHRYKTCTDVPGRNQWACSGYEWPLDQQNNVYSGEAEKDLAVVAAQTPAGTGTSENIILYLYVLWRFESDTLPSVVTHCGDLESFEVLKTTKEF